VGLFRSYLNSNPNSKVILYALGVLYYLNDQIQESIDTMLRLIKIDPNNADALNFVGYTYAERGENLDEAERMIKRALEITPNKGYILDSLGWVYYKKGRYDEALDLLHRAETLQPNDPAIMEHLGDVYLDNGDPSKALEYYQRGVDLINENPDFDDDALKQRLFRKLNDLKNITIQSSK